VAEFFSERDVSDNGCVKIKTHIYLSVVPFVR